MKPFIRLLFISFGLLFLLGLNHASELTPSKFEIASHGMVAHQAAIIANTLNDTPTGGISPDFKPTRDNTQPPIHRIEQLRSLGNQVLLHHCNSRFMEYFPKISQIKVHHIQALSAEGEPFLA